MVKMYRFFLYFLFFIVMLLLFFPKENLFFALEKELQTQKVLIVNEKIDESLFGLSLKDARVMVEKMEVANIKEAKIDFFLFYNSLVLRDIELSSVVGNFFPTHIRFVKMHYTIFNPLVVNGNAEGDFGTAKIEFSMKTDKLLIHLKPSKKVLQEFKALLRMLKKDKNGEYSYEKTL